MTDTYRLLDQREVPASATTLYTVPAATTVIIRHIRAVNTSASIAATLKIWHGGTANANLILPAINLGIGEYLVDDSVIIMQAAQTISAQASVATTITLSLYGVAIT